MYTTVVLTFMRIKVIFPVNILEENVKRGQ